MTESVELPALDGRDPLGFLAGLGVVRSLHHLDARLGWSPMSGAALLTSDLDGIDDVIAALVDVVRDLDDDELAPSLSSALLPVRTSDSGPDPARIERSALTSLVAEHPSSSELEWTRALWTDLAHDKEGRCARSPFNAPAGKQTLRSMFEKPLDFVRADPQRWIGDALRRWTRVPGYTGEGLESRAMRDAAEVSDGKLTSYGVPGATYLALLALPFFPVTGNGIVSVGGRGPGGTRRLTPGWHASPRGVEPRRPLFLWPLWEPPLGIPAISVVLDHPDVASKALAGLGDRSARPPRSTAMAPLGVWGAVVASRRARAGGKSEGFLTTEHVLRFR